MGHPGWWGIAVGRPEIGSGVGVCCMEKLGHSKDGPKGNWGEFTPPVNHREFF